MEINNEVNFRKAASWICKAPIKLSIGYLCLTILIYFWGPIKWKIDSPILLGFCLIIYYICFYYGYVFYIRRKIPLVAGKDLGDIFNYGFVYKKWIRQLFWISCVYAIFKFIIYTNTYYGGVSLNDLFDFGSSYFNRLHNMGAGTWKTAIIIYTNILSLFWFPIGTIYWKGMRKNDKCLFLITTLFSVVYWLNQGTLKGLGDIVILIIPSFILLLGRKKFLHSRIKTRSRNRLYIIFSIIVLFIVGFGIMQEQRMAYLGKEAGILNPINARFIESERVTIYPYITNYLAFYMTHGYTGMSLALELEPQWSYGVGSSRALMRTTENILNVNIINRTYPQRIENIYGWRNGMYWPSAFTWFASDITFWGIPFFMFFVGRFFAYVWFKFLSEQSVLTLVAVCQLFIFVVYLPANNQLFQSAESFYANVTLLILLVIRKPIIGQLRKIRVVH